LSALGATAGVSGYAGVSNTALLLWPSAGLVPVSLAVATAVRWAWRATRRRAKGRGLEQPVALEAQQGAAAAKEP
jgi:hypothetical protein